VTQVKLFFTQSATPVPIVVVQLAVVVDEELKRVYAASNDFLLSSLLDALQFNALISIKIKISFFIYTGID
jgi:hypothetical protein